tara:strand:+ start:6462 stop:7175 length:714 start_codon:yes stop_codon:yes gene_type:complete
MNRKMKLPKKNILKKFNANQVNFITVDGITCSGKSVFSNLLKKKLRNRFKNTLILSKDLFLFTREKRINFTKKLKKDFFKQNTVHYDLNKLNSLLMFLKKGNKKKTLVLKNLYNRTTGKNDLSIKFKFLDKRLIIFEGIYVNQDIKNTVKPILKILIIEKIYESLARKIERIRDKKISIQHVVTEFTKIHLQSFKKHLLKNNFDIIFKDKKRDFVPVYNGKKKQLDYIKIFLSKHLY